MRRSGPTRHHFVHASPPDVDARGVEWCAPPPQGCGLPYANAIHDVPERSDEEREHEARRLGEAPS